MIGAVSDDEHGWFRALFETHYAAVARYAGRRVRDDIAADVAAEVFLVAWRRRSEVPADSLPWLYGVARRVVANHRRGAERHSRLVERVATAAAVSATVPGPDDRADAAPSAFAAAFAHLSTDDRDVLGLVAWEGLNVPAIAQVLGCSVPAATMRLHRARRRLQNALDTHTETIT